MELSHINQYSDCIACGACVSVCKKGAIELIPDEHENLFPCVHESLCVACGRCREVCVCNHPLGELSGEHKAYIGFYEDHNVEVLSSSGGIFAGLARRVLEDGGVVFGAAMVYENDRLFCKHILVDNLHDLKRIQGSKYVHSQTQEVFPRVRDLLKSGKMVLFSGTSCQVMALKTFLGEKTEGLFTIDLVCHGVPEIMLLHNYISYLERKWSCKIVDISFRTKNAPGYEQSKESYILALTCVNKDGEMHTRFIHKNCSAYYRLFLSRACYRPNCYMCPYATIHKPSDITLGDFRPREEEMKKYHLQNETVYSSILVHTEKGRQLLDSPLNQRFTLTEIPLEQLVSHHGNLKTPSVITHEGKRFSKIYRKFGFAGLQYYIGIRKRFLRFMPKHPTV